MSDPAPDDTDRLADAVALVERWAAEVATDPDADPDAVAALAGRLRLVAATLQPGLPRGSRRARGPRGYLDAGFRL